MNGAQVPLGQLADIRLSSGPAMIRDEDAQLSGYVYVDMAGRDIGGYVEEAKRKVAEQIRLPPGYTLAWSGQYEYMQRAQERLIYIVPLTLLVIFLLLYINFKSVARCMIVLLAVPFSMIGAVWFLYLLGYNMSVAVWVGLIALAGVDAETGVIMLLYLEQAHEKWRKEGRLQTIKDLHDAIIEGAVKRIRPKVMTVMAILMGLLPIMWSHGAGADVMKRIAAPMIGGVISSFFLELLVYPVIFEIWRGWRLRPSSATGIMVHADRKIRNHFVLLTVISILGSALVWGAPRVSHAGETLALGERIYRENCAACHGERGDGRGPQADRLKAERGSCFGLHRFFDRPKRGIT
jgi:Cu(I)/Ag(I) efflux system membrane protein CusA/SilA